MFNYPPSIMIKIKVNKGNSLRLAIKLGDMMIKVIFKVFFNERDSRYDGIDLETYLNNQELEGRKLINCMFIEEYSNGFVYEMIFREKE